MTIVALDPTSGPLRTVSEHQLAPRPASLDGLRLGLVVNGLGRGEDLLDAVAIELGTIAGIAGVEKVVKASVSIPPDPGDWSRLTEGAAVAITGFGG